MVLTDGLKTWNLIVGIAVASSMNWETLKNSNQTCVANNAIGPYFQHLTVTLWSLSILMASSSSPIPTRKAPRKILTSTKSTILTVCIVKALLWLTILTSMKFLVSTILRMSSNIISCRVKIFVMSLKPWFLSKKRPSISSKEYYYALGITNVMNVTNSAWSPLKDCLNVICWSYWTIIEARESTSSSFQNVSIDCLRPFLVVL